MNKITADYLRAKVLEIIVIASHHGTTGEYKSIRYNPVTEEYMVVKFGNDEIFGDWQEAMDSYNYDLSGGR